MKSFSHCVPANKEVKMDTSYLGAREQWTRMKNAVGVRSESFMSWNIMGNSQWSEDWYGRKWEPLKVVENLPLCHRVPEGG